jgi:hypothetical protein
LERLPASWSLKKSLIHIREFRAGGRYKAFPRRDFITFARQKRGWATGEKGGVVDDDDDIVRWKKFDLSFFKFFFASLFFAKLVGPSLAIKVNNDLLLAL